MATTRMSDKALFVQRGYGQVEPNHLSAKWTGQIYAQLPADKDIEVLENGMFAKYDYKTGTVNFTGEGEWMLVYNEVKVYRDYQSDADFAMKKGDYDAKIFSPGGKVKGTAKAVNYNAAVKGADPYEVDSTADPMNIVQRERQTAMADGTVMVPRLLKTNVGDIFTTNTIALETVTEGTYLAPGADGYLTTAGDDATMKWLVAKVYDLADGQQAAKLVRVA